MKAITIQVIKNTGDRNENNDGSYKDNENEMNEEKKKTRRKTTRTATAINQLEKQHHVPAREE